MTTVLMTHGPTALERYFGVRALAQLRALAGIRHRPDDDPWALDALVAAASGCRVVIADRATAGPAELLERLPDAVAFCRCAVDIRNIDVAAASRQGILVTRCSAGFMASVSEWIVGVMIALARGLSTADAAYHRGQTPIPAMGRELRGATLGIVGFGRIARHLVGPAQALGLQILVSDPFAPIDDPRVLAVPFDRLLSDADFVVCLAVANEATENLFDAQAFAAMKPGAFFINPSRGDLVDEQALLAALDGGRLAGCGLDVGRAPDQMPSPVLAQHPRVIASPHIGGLTLPAIEHQALEVVAQVAAILDGRLPGGAVNPEGARRLRVDPGR